MQVELFFMFIWCTVYQFTSGDEYIIVLDPLVLNSMTGMDESGGYCLFQPASGNIEMRVTGASQSLLHFQRLLLYLAYMQ